MTESQWLTSEDQQAMLMHLDAEQVGYTESSGASGPVMQRREKRLTSERKLRLFACACYRAAYCEPHCNHASTDFAEQWIDSGCPKDKRPEDAWFIYGTDPAGYAARMDLPDRRKKCDLLRDIVGNPHRPVELAPEEPSDPFAALDVLAREAKRSGVTYISRSLLTPTVVSLATAAYEERDRRCNVCSGSGGYTRSSNPAYWCGKCRGTSVINDGTLDPFRLALLADALEDAGLTDARPCPCRRDWDGTWEDLSDSDRGLHGGRWKVRKHCPDCREIGVVSDGILAHLRSPGPHFRGCWALDVVLGKE